MPYSMTREENVFLAKRNIIDSIYREARLEGIHVTFSETREIFEGRAAAGLWVDDTVAINNLKHAWVFLLENIDSEDGISFACELHALVGADLVLDAGKLRSGSVGIGGTEWRPPIPSMQAVEALFEEVLAQEPSTERALELFMRMAKAQLFWDGNKRTAQLMANKLLIEGGFGIFSVPVGKIPEFNAACIEYYNSDDQGPFMAFLLESCIEGF